MPALSWTSVRHYRVLFTGAFITMTLGVALLGVIARALAAVLAAPTPGSGPSVRVADGTGTVRTFVRDAPDLGGITTVLALTGVVTGVVMVVVVAGTFAFSVALRRRDLGLLRLLGASRGQTRRLILGEAVAIAVPAAATGCVLAALATPAALTGLNRSGLTPVPLEPAGLAGPLLAGSLLGLLLATLAALAASRRASRIRPVQALREADLDSGVLTTGRTVVGGLLLLGAVVMITAAPQSGAEAATPLSIFGPLVLAIAAALFGPLYLPPLARLLGAPLRRCGPVGGLAVAAASTARRRTASLTGPVLAIVAVVGIILSVLDTTRAAVTADEQARNRAQLVVTPARGAGLDLATLARLTAVPGVRAVSAPAQVTVVVAAGSSVQALTAVATDLPALRAVQQVRAVHGDLGSLGGRQVAVSAEYAGWFGLRAGSTVRLAFFDGRTVDATVRAVVDGGPALPQVLIPPALAGDQAGPIPQAYVRLAAPPTADPAAAARDLTAVLGPERVRVTQATRFSSASATTDRQDRLNRLVLLILAGPASVFALTAIANVMVMGSSRRGREISELRLLGVRRREIRALILGETALVTALAVTIAAAVIALALAVFRAGLDGTYLRVPVTVPWSALSALVAACFLVAALAGQLSVGRLLRGPAAASRE